jgi:hypothetical protein
VTCDEFFASTTQDALNVVAQLAGSGNIVARFVFATKPNVPDYIRRRPARSVTSCLIPS